MDWLEWLTWTFQVGVWLFILAFVIGLIKYF